MAQEKVFGAYEHLQRIFTFVQAKDLYANACLMCQQWYNLIQDSTAVQRNSAIEPRSLFQETSLSYRDYPGLQATV